MTDVKPAAATPLLVVGESLVDVVVRDGEPVERHVGGSPANVAIGLARLGHDVRLETCLGPDGDVAGSIMAARPDTGVDLLVGIGGTPEGIISACAITCLGGTIQGRLWPKDDEERQRAIDAGHDLDRVLHTRDLVDCDNVFFVATGITDGELLRGVRYRAGGATTHSLVMRSKSGTIRVIESHHRLSKLKAYSAVDFESGR